MTVEVACGTAERQEVIELQVPPGTTLIEAVKMSGIAEHFPGIDPDQMAMGIFGKQTDPDQPLQPNDRVELYRPLVMDPKEARRRRARQNR
ncbi:MAG: RnfH family protein [Pseudomonadales bacterium]|nr:RnfH family protein [Pseudomonadales bacterium]